MKPDRKITVAAAVYACWIVFYTVNHYVQAVPLPPNAGSWVLIAASLFYTVITAAKIPGYRYSPLILMTVFAVFSRLTAIAADFTARSASGYALFMLPFGGFDFFVYSLMLVGILHYITKRIQPPSAGFSPLVLLPLLLLILPVFADLLPAGLCSATLYSFVYAAVAAWTLGASIVFRLKLPGSAALARAAGLSVILDMLVYAERFSLPFELPEGLPRLLAPFGLFLLVHAFSLISQEDIND